MKVRYVLRIHSMNTIVEVIAEWGVANSQLQYFTYYSQSMLSKMFCAN